jgi:UDP-N-acetylmuramate dehydrogenase
MRAMTFIDQLKSILQEDEILLQEPMNRHTTFQTGGPADYFLLPKEEELGGLIELCKAENMPFMVIGNGSNLLVSDEGIRGCVICIGSQMNGLYAEGRELHVGAGTMLSQAAAEAKRQSLTGMEFASGIPGTVGGALVMNAGAYGGEMKDILKSVRVLNRDGSEEELTKEAYQGGYRSSAIMKSGAIVLSAVFSLEEGEQDAIAEKMKELNGKRREKQPLEYPSAGSTFKRPEGYFAGKLIQDSGLSGYQVGGAQVSEKHCGFVINRGGASSMDIYRLMQDCIRKVKEKTGVTLEPEVRLIGNFHSE